MYEVFEFRPKPFSNLEWAHESEQMFVADVKKQPLSERKPQTLCSQKWNGREVKLNFAVKHPNSN